MKKHVPQNSKNESPTTCQLVLGRQNGCLSGAGCLSNFLSQNDSKMTLYNGKKLSNIVLYSDNANLCNRPDYKTKCG